MEILLVLALCVITLCIARRGVYRSFEKEPETPATLATSPRIDVPPARRSNATRGSLLRSQGQG
jgi:hypothetical protein